jgi:quinol monooxygenase YgiN
MYVLIYECEPRNAASFNLAFGNDGERAKFFRQGTGYLCTELLQNTLYSHMWLVIDRWESSEAYAAHKEAFLAASKALDERCGRLFGEGGWRRMGAYNA